MKPRLSTSVPSTIVLLVSMSCYPLSAQQPGTGTDPAWQAPTWAAAKKNPVPATKDAVAAGRAIYAGSCVPCHGTTGKGDGPAAAFLGRHPSNLDAPVMWEQTDGALFWKITEGNTPMPSFGRV